MVIAIAIFSRHVVGLARGGSVQASHRSAPSASSIEYMLRSAEAFARRWLSPLTVQGDRIGSRLIDGRIVTPANHKPAWQACRDDGWLLIDRMKRQS